MTEGEAFRGTESPTLPRPGLKPENVSKQECRREHPFDFPLDKLRVSSTPTTPNRALLGTPVSRCRLKLKRRGRLCSTQKQLSRINCQEHKQPTHRKSS